MLLSKGMNTPTFQPPARKMEVVDGGEKKKDLLKTIELKKVMWIVMESNSSKV